jgi:DNA polymerase zeta
MQIIPALDRILSLVGVDCSRWYQSMNRVERSLPQKRARVALPLPMGVSFSGMGGGPGAPQPGGTIDAFYLSRHCAVCDGQTSMDRPVCEGCMQDPQVSNWGLTEGGRVCNEDH